MDRPLLGSYSQAYSHHKEHARQFRVSLGAFMIWVSHYARQVMQYAAAVALQNRFFSCKHDHSDHTQEVQSAYVMSHRVCVSQGLVGIISNPVLANGVAGLATSATAFAAVERTLLYQMRNETVEPFGETVQQVFARISALRDSLDGPQVSS